MIAPKEHAALIALLDQHKPLNCGSCGNEILPALGKLDQSGLPLDAAVYKCRSGNCEWMRTVKIEVSSVERTTSVGLEMEI